jgi:hypothetical protein
MAVCIHFEKKESEVVGLISYQINMVQKKILLSGTDIEEWRG